MFRLTFLHQIFSKLGFCLQNLITNPAGKGILVVRKTFDGEMSVRTSQTTLLQIFCKTILNFKVIVKSILDPDDNFKSNT